MNEFTLKLNERDLQLIGNALQVRPYIEVAALISKIEMQVNSKVESSKETSDLDREK